jgi:DNA-binding transcriptional LysR family regulator
MEWDDLKIILAIGRAGTLSGAAKSLNLNHSTVFRRINIIEDKLNVRFFERMPNGYILTEAGEVAMLAAEKIDDEMNSLTRELVGKDLRLQGTIRVTAPEGVSLKLLQPIFADFIKLNPEIHIDLVVTGSTLQLSRREADLAVRVTNKPPETSIGRRICHFRFGVYASRGYLKSKKDFSLKEHDWILLDNSSNWFPQSFWKKMGHPGVKLIFSSDSTMAIVNAVKDGLGVAPLPCFLGDSETKLVRIVEPTEEMALELWLLTHPDLRHTTRVKALMNFLYEALLQKKELIEGNRATQFL